MRCVHVVVFREKQYSQAERRGGRMPRTMKIGGLDVVLPDDSPLGESAGNETATRFQAEKPEEPAKLESPQYVFRPNDPFQSNVDRMVALGNVQNTKPWVRK